MRFQSLSCDFVSGKFRTAHVISSTGAHAQIQLKQPTNQASFSGSPRPERTRPERTPLTPVECSLSIPGQVIGHWLCPVVTHLVHGSQHEERQTERSMQQCIRYATGPLRQSCNAPTCMRAEVGNQAGCNAMGFMVTTYIESPATLGSIVYSGLHHRDRTQLRRPQLCAGWPPGPQ